MNFGINQCICRLCSSLKICTELIYFIHCVNLFLFLGLFVSSLKNKRNVVTFSCPTEPLLTFRMVTQRRGFQNTHCPHYGPQRCFIYNLHLTISISNISEFIWIAASLSLMGTSVSNTQNPLDPSTVMSSQPTRWTWGRCHELSVFCFGKNLSRCGPRVGDTRAVRERNYRPWESWNALQVSVSREEQLLGWNRTTVPRRKHLKLNSEFAKVNERFPLTFPLYFYIGYCTAESDVSQFRRCNCHLARVFFFHPAVRKQIVSALWWSWLWRSVLRTRWLCCREQAEGVLCSRRNLGGVWAPERGRLEIWAPGKVRGPADIVGGGAVPDEFCPDSCLRKVSLDITGWATESFEMKDSGWL